MSLWATERKLTYVSIFIIVLLVAFAWPTYHFLYKPPTCQDGKQDQGEQGVDCGGPCALLCPAQALTPIVQWDRVFPAIPGFYNAVAYIENPNLDSYAENVAYEFDLYAADGSMIARRTGTVNIWANTDLPIFEPDIAVGSSTPKTVTFEFTGNPVWSKSSLIFPQIVVTDPVFSQLATSPHLTAVISNNNLTAVQNLPVVAIAYDADGNALAVSKTVVSYLQNGTPQSVFFAWPTAFAGTVSVTDIIPIVSPIAAQ